MKHSIALILCCLTLPLLNASGQSDSSPAPAAGPMSLPDVVVYGDSSGAVVAAIAAKREGRSVIWVNPTGFPGGMSSSGLGATDFLGYRNTFGGIASEFYDGVAAAYGTDFVRSLEPHVGKQVFEQMIAAAGVTVAYNERLDRTSGKGVTMDGKRIKAITTLSGKTYHGKMFIDATYVGDLMAAAGVTYTVGREPESQYGEDLAGVRRGDTKPRVHYGQRDKDHFVKEVDPYVRPGDPASGLLPHFHHIEGLKNGQGDKKIQAYNYRVCLTTNPENRIPIDKPPGYREIDHELLLRNFDAGVIWRVPPKPYGISYRSIIPPKGQCENLFSPICLSASHVAHGSIRMEPVFMALSQSAAIAAGLAIDGKLSVQDVAYPRLHQRLLAAKQIVDVSQVPERKPKAAPKRSAP